MEKSYKSYYLATVICQLQSNLIDCISHGLLQETLLSVEKVRKLTKKTFFHTELRLSGGISSTSKILSSMTFKPLKTRQ